MAVQLEDPPVTRPRRRPTFFVGLVLVAAGLALLGYVGWQFFGTNIASRQAHDRIAANLEREWDRAEPTARGRTPGEASLGDAVALIRIPRFGDDYVVPVLNGTSDDVLAQGYGWFEGSAPPGARGNFALAGHRVTHGEPLRHMPELRPGDSVHVETRDAVYVYRLDTDPEDLVVDFQDGWVVDPLPTNPVEGGVQPPSRQPGQRLITLTTCAELFHDDDRMIAFGHLVDTAPK